MITIINMKSKMVTAVEDTEDNRSLLRGVYEDMAGPKPNPAIEFLQAKTEDEWKPLPDLNQFFDGPVAIVKF
jgi:hypothetical protein